MISIEGVFGIRLSRVIRGTINQITDINRKYHIPRIKMSRNVKIALLFLRLYLIFLVVLLAYKFWTMVQGG